MHVYVGLDLGVKDEEIKNSFAPGFTTQRVRRGSAEFECNLHDNVTTVPPQCAHSTFLQFEPQPELEKGLPAPPE
jgi:hypothetical protein